MRVAALDLGSNTFLCLIAEVENGVIQKVFSDEVEVVRLGQELATRGTFHPAALERARNCLNRFSHNLKTFKPDRVLAAATAAARTAKNPESLLQICQDASIPLQIIPGQKEAELSFQGAISGLQGHGPFGVVDIGGGSTEVIVGTREKILWSRSLPFGAVKLTEEFLTKQPPPTEELQKLKNHIQNELMNIQVALETVTTEKILWVAVAGTPTELVSALIGGFSAEKVDGYILTVDQLGKYDDEFTKTTTQEREKMGIGPGRSDVILAGNQVLLQFAKNFSPQGLQVSIRGVRYGVALAMAARPSSVL